MSTCAHAREQSIWQSSRRNLMPGRHSSGPSARPAKMQVSIMCVLTRNLLRPRRRTGRKKPETPCGNAGQHDTWAQVQSCKTSVEARASQHEKRFMNKQKQFRRHLRRREQLDVAHAKKKEICCLVDAFRAFGLKVSYDRDGPFWVLKEGTEMLRPFGYIISPVSRICSTGPGRWLVCRDGHCIALRRKGEDNTWIFDGGDRRRVAARDLNTLMRGAKIFQVPSRLS